MWDKWESFSSPDVVLIKNNRKVLAMYDVIQSGNFYYTYTNHMVKDWYVLVNMNYFILPLLSLILGKFIHILFIWFNVVCDI